MDMGESQMEMFPGDPTHAGAAGALVVTEGYTPSHQETVIYFATDDILAFLARAIAAGGKTLMEKMSIGEFGFIAQFEDSRQSHRAALHVVVTCHRALEPQCHPRPYGTRRLGSPAE